MIFVTTAVIAGIINIFAIPLVLAVAHRRGWFDKSDERKIHKGNIPRLGGIGITLSAALSFVAAVAWIAPSSRQAFPFDLPSVVVVAGFATMAGLGLADDFLNLKARWKLLVQVAVAIAVVAAGYSFRRLALPFGLPAIEFGYAGPVVTLLWLVGVMNAINLIDGLDGLAGGVSVIAAGAYTYMAYRNGDVATGVMASAVLGAGIGFLFYNFPPASIFMGDAGSLFFGFAVGVLPLSLARNGSTAPNLAMGITIALIPILDTVSAIIRRARSRVPFYTPDRMHLHHKLLGFGLSGRQILAVIYTMSLLLAMTAISVTYLSDTLAVVLMYAAWLVVGGVFIAFHYMKEGSVVLVHRGEDEE